ncbi:hypothetical protein HK105_209138 [Polyrhizophydium stewartii]|uniref:Fe2OG dioxygenase domain-containing protein n=1 Tax=Polyrhizophydium stewartii TaxID=2732419 RepID=A0ABR4MVW4_9FUNG
MQREFPADCDGDAGGGTESYPAAASAGCMPAAASTKPSSCRTAPSATAKETAAVAASADQSADLRIDPPTDRMAAPKPAPIARAITRMRWATLGFQYNWTLKEYFFDRRPAFPPSVDAITREIVTLLAPVTGYSTDCWRSEAGIVNFHHPGDTLTAHQDRSEIDMDAPLVSLSIGLDAVFLFGTESRDDKPVALRLRSGDVVVMAGPARRAFHGVPLVLPDTCPEYLRDAAASWDAGSWAGEHDSDPVSDDEARELAEFMGTTRININGEVGRLSLAHVLAYCDGCVITLAWSKGGQHLLPLISQSFSLNCLTLNQMQPFQIAVAGDDPSAFLYDRHFVSRPLAMYPPRDLRQHDDAHVTGLAFSSSGTEIVGSWSNRAVYLFDTSVDAADAQIRILVSASSPASTSGIGDVPADFTFSMSLDLRCCGADLHDLDLIRAECHFASDAAALRPESCFPALQTSSDDDGDNDNECLDDDDDDGIIEAIRTKRH